MKAEKEIILLRERFRPKDDVRGEVRRFLEKLSGALVKKGVDVMLGGSVAKGTYLPGTYDADIFARFPEEYRDKDLSSELRNALDELTIGYEVLHGSRDYFRVENNVLYEVVPVLKISDSSEALNIADVSPLHVSYFNSKATQSIRDDVRVLKAFLRANNLYGAESHIKGFSGHVVDLLILYYGSFLGLLKKARYWEEKTVIDIERQYSRQEALMFLNESKISGPLIVVDPVQKNRNAAAALSLESFNAFKSLARDFLKNPSDEFFRQKTFDELLALAKQKNRGARHFVVSITPLDSKDDVAGAKALKIKEFLERKLSENEFVLLGSVWSFEPRGAAIILSVDDKELPEKQVIPGPPIDMEFHVKSFRKKHRIVFEKKGKLYAERKRKYSSPASLLRSLLKSDYVKQKCISSSLAEA